VKISIRTPQKLSNSRLALLGGEIAREAGGFEQYHEAVFHAYFQLGEDIGDLAVLLRIAEGAGIGADEFQKSLGEKRFVESLKAAHREAHSRGIAAVPSFVLLNGGIITGVQAYGVMKNMIQQSIDPELQKGESCC
jgi:predicted DsbA family dithiol-disulfide isomerase